jgi:cytochrome P450 family 135
MSTATSPPPGPRTPRAIQTLRFMRDEPRYLEALHAQFGDAFRIQVERRPWHLLAHPDAIKQVFQAPPTVVHAGDANEILRNPLGGHSVLVLDEGEHMRQRKLLLPAFHGDRLRAQRETMERVARAEVERMPVGRAFSLRPHTQAIALEVILEVVLGVSRAERERHAALAAPLDRFLDWFADTKHLLSAVVLGPDSGFVKRQHRRISSPVDAQLYPLIRDRRAAGDLEQRSDVLAMLLLARDEDGVPMSDEEIRDELVTLIVAGHETTATALAWAFERLTRHPADLRRLEEESRTESTDFAEAVGKEALRLRPVLMNVLRTLREPLEVGGHVYPQGAVLAPSIYLVQRRPELWGADAAEFRPARFLEDDVPGYAWIPFGGGVRRCIGAAFAQMEMEVVLRAIAGAVRLEPVGAEERAIARFITASPERGGEVRVSSRRAGAAGDETAVAIAA